MKRFSKQMLYTRNDEGKTAEEEIKSLRYTSSESFSQCKLFQIRFYKSYIATVNSAMDDRLLGDNPTISEKAKKETEKISPK
ncbi:unnamed protein product [Dracunculus medinensis]|uniref:Uncharacterized protein n=1 Tax=Dracunculus medinensis TaxID=318479 RepID=A0A0N4UKR8_DRAME|nr:unnamed protein product [Dracunculus medinensis]